MNPSNLLKSLMCVWLLVLIGGACALGQQAQIPAARCESLTKLTLPNTTITMAQIVAAGEFKTPTQGGPGGPGRQQGAPDGQAGPGGPGGPGGPQGGPGGGPGGGVSASSLPEFCRVAASIKPTSDSDIRIEVFLPMSGWNGKFLAAANIGWGGSIQYGAMYSGLNQGYATAATDTGHQTNDYGAFLIGHPEKLVDYAYRADHEMTVKAKALIKAFYGSDPKHSFWVGCSLGGLEALMEARRYPEDYDGIVAGSPVTPLTGFNAAQLWMPWLANKFPDGVIPAAKFTAVYDTELKACATPTGQKHRVIEDPANCHFDPAVLLCKGADNNDCLTQPQVDLLRKFHAGPTNFNTGENLFYGPPVGIELRFSQDGGLTAAKEAIGLYANAVHQDPTWDFKTMDPGVDVAKAHQVVDPLLLVDSNLSEFIKRGGKLMMYIGWAEFHNPLDLIDFYKKALKSAGVDESKNNSLRLFTVPGMGHCGGGNGCDTFEKLGTLEQWVDSNKAPDQILSSKMSGGKVVRTEPLCAYPAIAKYKGTGSEEDAANFVCSK